MPPNPDKIEPEKPDATLISAVKTELFRREIPRQYDALIKEVKFAVSPQSFSRDLDHAISRRALILKSKFGRLIIKGVSDIEEILESSSTSFGKILAQAIKEKDVIDLACGEPEKSLIRTVAEACHAKRYIGVDIELPDKEVKTYGLANNQSFQAIYIKDDVLSFVAKLEKSENGILFYISGFEPVALLDQNRIEELKKTAPNEVQKDQQTRTYIDACLKEIARITQTGDVVVIDKRTHGFYPENYGFKLKAKIKYYSLYEKIS